MSNNEQLELRRDAQIRQVRNGFVVTVQTRVVGTMTQKVHETASEDLVAGTAVDAANFVMQFMSQEPNQPAEGEVGQADEAE